MTASAPRSWPFFPIHLFHLHNLASFSAELRFVTEPRAPLFLYGPTPLEYFSNGDTLSPKMFFDCHAVNSPKSLTATYHKKKQSFWGKVLSINFG
jgi:hypothetical protein